MENYFTDKELACHCCGVTKMDKMFMIQLNFARQIAGIPFIITSGYRCPKHNQEVGSTSTNHTRGKAVDINCGTSENRFKILHALFYTDISGIGVGVDMIHADTNHPTKMVWLYP